MRPRPFILLDLHTQAEFIPQEVRKWPRDRILAWFRQFGEVREYPIDVGDVPIINVLFIAPTGLRAGFILYDNGRLLMVGDHTTWVGWE
jgi:hypothetical protein